LSYSIHSDDIPRLAILVQNRVIDVGEASAWIYRKRNHLDFRDLPITMRSALDSWVTTFPLLQDLASICEDPDGIGLTIEGSPFVRPEERINHHPPVIDPPTFRDFYGFEQHVRSARERRGLEMVPEWYEMPAFYFSNPHSFLGHNEPLEKPLYTSELDFELEVACVIGKGGIDIAPEDADDHIAGYTVLNDWSARDIQRKEMRVGLGPAKGKDFASSLGPCLVTLDELETRRAGNAYDLEMTARKNETVLSRGNLKEIYHGFPDMIAWASRGVRLLPGDIIGSGTVGTGCILELGPERTGGWLEPGDIIELEVEGIGLLRTPII
jgi:fumarylacetoacetate (FAA) hydrolase